MNISESEFNLFCLELSKVAAKHGIDSDMISTIIAEAIRNREMAIGNSKKGESEVSDEEVHEVIVEPVQPLYAPPSESDSIEYVIESPPQALYAPPSSTSEKTRKH